MLSSEDNGRARLLRRLLDRGEPIPVPRSPLLAPRPALAR